MWEIPFYQLYCKHGGDRDAEKLKEGAYATALLFDESNIAKEAAKQYNRVVDAMKDGQLTMTGQQKQYIFLSNSRRGERKWKTKIVS